jgi:hypothetical protein
VSAAAIEASTFVFCFSIDALCFASLFIEDP